MKKLYEQPIIEMTVLPTCDVLSISPTFDDKNYLKEEWFDL